MSWVIPGWLCVIGLAAAAAGAWIVSTTPGDLEAMAWDHRTSTQIGTVIGLAGLFTTLVSSLYCAWLVVEGCYELRRHTPANRAARIHEIAWNAAGVLVTVAAIGAVVIVRRS